MLKLVAARVVFAIGLFVLVYVSGGGLIPASMTLYAIIGYILFCELAIANPIKARIDPPLSTLKKGLSILPWLFPFTAIALAILVPVLRG